MINISDKTNPDMERKTLVRMIYTEPEHPLMEKIRPEMFYESNNRNICNIIKNNITKHGKCELMDIPDIKISYDFWLD